MSTRHTILVLAAAIALGAPAAAAAEDASFSYLEGGFIGGFVNDVEQSGTITGSGPLELETDAGGGGFLGGAWQVGESLHLFGEYSSASQDLDVSDGTDTVSGEFDIVRWRIGVGYARPISAETTFYGRLSLDSAELKDVQVAGFDLAVDGDETGAGGEVGVIWAATPSFHLQGHARYTAVGEVVSEGSDTFDADTLFGLTGRWYFQPGFALVTGYEFGKITTVNVGVRFTF